MACGGQHLAHIRRFGIAIGLCLGIQADMNRVALCSLTLTVAATLALMASIGCSPAQRSPDAIRQDTAKATAEAARDTKAVVEGVVDGLKTKGAVNINKASADQLQSLPGISDVEARHIIAARPYANSDELVKRHVISKSEYDRIATQVETR